MKISAILFDLDGSLLPMDQEQFMKAYLGGLGTKLAPYGYDPRALVKAIWNGTSAMIQNNGSATNETVFWESFTAELGPQVREHQPVFEDFYRNEFQQVRGACGFDPLAAETTQALRAMGLRLVLATNPLFPAIATESRIRWAGLEPGDFELYTTYENASFCKPNLDYYRQILTKLQLDPAQCVMVGNDVDEDMIAKELGMRVFLLPRCLINKEGKNISGYPQGDLKELLAQIRSWQTADSGV